MSYSTSIDEDLIDAARAVMRLKRHDVNDLVPHLAALADIDNELAALVKRVGIIFAANTKDQP